MKKLVLVLMVSFLVMLAEATPRLYHTNSEEVFFGGKVTASVSFDKDFYEVGDVAKIKITYTLDVEKNFKERKFAIINFKDIYRYRSLTSMYGRWEYDSFKESFQKPNFANIEDHLYYSEYVSSNKNKILSNKNPIQVYKMKVRILKEGDIYKNVKYHDVLQSTVMEYDEIIDAHGYDFYIIQHPVPTTTATYRFSLPISSDAYVESYPRLHNKSINFLKTVERKKK